MAPNNQFEQPQQEHPFSQPTKGAQQMMNHAANRPTGRNVFSQPGNPGLQQLRWAMQNSPNPLQQQLAGMGDQRSDPYIRGTQIQTDGSIIREILSGNYGLAQGGMNLLGQRSDNADQYHAGIGWRAQDNANNLQQMLMQSILNSGGDQAAQLDLQNTMSQRETDLGLQSLLAGILNTDSQGQWQLDNTQQQGYNDALTTDMGVQGQLAGIDQTNQLGYQGLIAELMGQSMNVEGGLANTGLGVWGDLQGQELGANRDIALGELGANTQLVNGFQNNLASLIGGNNQNNAGMFNNMYSTNVGANVANMNAGNAAYMQDARLSADSSKYNAGLDFAKGILGEGFSVQNMLDNNNFQGPTGFYNTDGSGQHAQYFPKMVT